MKRTFEFWAIDKDGMKHNNYYHTKISRINKVKKLIEQKYGIEIDKCIDFGIRETTE